MDFVNKTVAKFAKAKNKKIKKLYSKLLLVTSGLDLGLGVKVGKMLILNTAVWEQ
ncbi:MAG: hypothetical protein MSH11_01335 [Ruminococcus sp.]|nr:hypothetical protein [Ruminococcus sp.]